jgi:hypothetical protein
MPPRPSNPISPRTITVHVPLTLPIYGGRKSIISAEAAADRDQLRGRNLASTPAGRPPRHETENAILKALARAHRWRGKIESGEYGSIAELAKAENVNDSYACRLLRLTLLAPTIISYILDKRPASDLMLKQLMKPITTQWDHQPEALGIIS